MDPKKLRALLAQVKSGALSIDEGARALGGVAELPFATLDVDRPRRQGYPEVVYGAGKTPEQLVGIVERLAREKAPVLVTRVAPEGAEALVAAFPKGEHHPLARAFVVRRKVPRAGRVAVITAGTSDLPVAEEAALTAELLGCAVVRVVDVGVAGIHRLLRRREEIAGCDVAVVCAGMEGALPTAVGGLVGIPVVAVPTSIGYGASLGGVAALLGMLNSCAPNVAVVNIDNGFGGGFYAALVARRGKRSGR
jgi:NCAIR mutase (PurE)-related protein